ncbi:MAG: hypothetical protein Q4B26_12130 [Eubacteriales bacterium]|nr:hypothetical protein [Eubacteriales bacterium]
MTPRDKAIKELETNGYHFERHGKKHAIYHSDEKNYSIPVKRHDFDEDDLRYILKEIKKGGR